MEPLMIRRVRLRDFLSHADTELEFGQGVNVLIGPNGAGKSGILEAIYFALTRKGWRTTQNRVQPLIREGRGAAEVVLEFEVGGSRYVIRRFIGKNRQDIITVDGKVAAQGKDNVTGFVNSLLGLRTDQLDKVVLIPQGGITRLFTQLKGKERKEAIDKLLGLNIYQEVGEVIKNTPITAHIGSVSTTFYPKRLNQLVNDARRVREGLEVRREQVRKELEEVSNEVGVVKERLRELSARAKELEERARKYDELDEELRRARAEREALEARLRDAISEASKLRSALSEAEEVVRRLGAEVRELEERAKLAALRPAVEELGRLLERASALEKRVRTARERFRELEEKRRRIEGLEAAVPAPIEELRERLASALAEKEKLSDRKSFFLSMLARVSEREESLKEALLRDKASLSEAAETVSKTIGKRVMPEELVDLAESLLERLKKESEAVEKEISELNQREGALRSSIDDSERKLNLIKRSETPRCPLCGRPLTREHRERIIKQLEDEIRSMTRELEAVRKRLGELSRKREEIQKVLSVVTPGLIRALKEIRKRVTEAEEELSRLREEEERLNDELERVNKELRKRAEEEAILRKAITDAEILEELRKGFSPEDHDRARKEVEEAEKELEEARARARVITERIASEAGVEGAAPEEVYGRVRAVIEGAEEAARKLAEARARLTETVSRAEELRKELTAREETIESLKSRLAEVSKVISALEERLRDAKAAREELERLRGEEAAMRERLASLKEKRAGLAKEAEELRRALEELRRAFRIAYVASWLAEKVFHRDGIPRKMRPKILRVLETQVEKLLDRFNLGFQDVHIDEEYEVTLAPIDNPRARRPITSLSGGEQVSVSMAVLLAMFQTISGSKIGFMALDEPTEYLDEERQRALVDLFRRFRGGRILPQLIVVTHDESIKEVADRLYLVEKVDGVSRVTPVEPGEWV